MSQSGIINPEEEDDIPKPTGSVSSTRLYLGNLPRKATRSDVENHFNAHGHGKILEIKLMNGFGFIEYEDPDDARDVVPTFHGSEFMGERLVVQYARGSHRAPYEDRDGSRPQPPRPRRTQWRMAISGLPDQCSWQDLKDFARSADADVVYSEVLRERDDQGAPKGFVEYETNDALNAAVAKLHGVEFKGVTVQCVADPQPDIPRPVRRFRSRSPGYRPRDPRDGRPPYGGPPQDGYYDPYDRRGPPPPPRGYSPQGYQDYRRRSPPPQHYRDDYRNDWRGDYRGGYYDDRRDDRGYGPPPRRGPGPQHQQYNDYPPQQPRGPRGGYDDRGPPPHQQQPPIAPRGDGPQYGSNGHGREPYPPSSGPPDREPARGPGGPGGRNRGYWEREDYGEPRYWYRGVFPIYF